MSLPLDQYPIPPDVTVDRVLPDDEWTRLGPEGSYYYSAEVTFDLTIQSSPDTDIFLLTRTGLTDGNIEITSERQMYGVAQVKIHVKYNSESVFRLLLVARISKIGGREQGVGIFVPNGYLSLNNVDIQSTFCLPSDDSSSPAINMWTDAPDTPLKVSDVRGVNFEAVQLVGAHQTMDVNYLKMTDGQFKNEGGDIQGQFDSTRALLYKSARGTIDVTAGLEDIGIAEPALSASSDYGLSDITTNLNLSCSRGTGGTFHVQNNSAEGLRTNVKVQNAPLYSSLNLNVHNRGPAYVYLHPTFEGNFRQETKSNEYTPKFWDQNVQDPAGQGRSRTITVSAQPNPYAGVIYWGNDPLVGNVNVETQDGDNMIFV